VSVTAVRVRVSIAWSHFLLQCRLSTYSLVAHYTKASIASLDALGMNLQVTRCGGGGDSLGVNSRAVGKQSCCHTKYTIRKRR